MKSSFLIFLLVCIGAGYFYYETQMRKPKPQQSSDDAEIAAQVMDAQVEDYTAPEVSDKLTQRLLLEAKKLFPEASEEAHESWARTQKAAKDKIDALKIPSYIPESEYKNFTAYVRDANPFQYQNQYIELKKALGYIADMERVSKANGVDTADFNEKRAEVEKKFRFDYKKQSEFMSEYAEAKKKMASYKNTLPKEEFTQRVQRAMKKYPFSPAEAVKEFADQCAAADRIESEFSDPKYAARVRIAENEFPFDYVKRYESLKAASDVSTSKGAVALMDLKNARGEPISTEPIFLLRTITGAKPATLTSLRGRKVLLMPFFVPEEGSKYTFENGKETVVCSKFICSKDYPITCFFPDSEPQTAPAVFMTAEALAQISGLPEIVIGPNEVGVLSMDAVVPTVTGEAHVRLESPLKSFTSGCVMIDKATGIYVSLSVDYPRAPYLPERASLPSADTLVGSETPDARVYRNLILRLSTFERVFREKQELGMNRFVKPSELENWDNLKKENIDAQYALLEKIYKRSKALVKFFMTNNLESISEVEELKPLYEKASAIMRKSSKATRGQQRDYHSALMDFVRKDIYNVSPDKFNAALREEAEHQLEIRKMIIDYITSAASDGNLEALYPQ